MAAPSISIESTTGNYFLYLRGNENRDNPVLSTLGIAHRCVDALSYIITSVNRPIFIDTADELSRWYDCKHVVLMIPGGHTTIMSRTLRTELQKVRECTFNIFGSCAGAYLLSRMGTFADYHGNEMLMHCDPINAKRSHPALSPIETLGVLPAYAIGPAFKEGKGYGAAPEDYIGRIAPIYDTASQSVVNTWWNSGPSILPADWVLPSWSGARSKKTFSTHDRHTPCFTRCFYTNPEGPASTFNMDFESALTSEVRGSEFAVKGIGATFAPATICSHTPERNILATGVHPELIMTSEDAPPREKEANRDLLKTWIDFVDR
jgi:hypothetical protein